MSQDTIERTVPCGACGGFGRFPSDTKAGHDPCGTCDGAGHIPNLDWNFGQEKKGQRYVVRNDVYGRGYWVWDRETRLRMQPFGSHSGANTYAFWLNCGWPAKDAWNAARNVDVWASAS